MFGNYLKLGKVFFKGLGKIFLMSPMKILKDIYFI